MADDAPVDPAEVNGPSQVGPVQFLPILYPISGHTSPPPRLPLTSEQLQQLQILIDHFNSSDFSPPTTLADLRSSRKPTGIRSLFSSSSQPLSIARKMDDVEKCFWSRGAFLRSLRAVKWDTEAALARSLDILVWRREFAGGVEGLTFQRIENEGITGKELILGYD